MNTDHQTTLGDLVVANPAVARVLDGLGLDYCCHGDRTLDQACAEGSLDPDEVAARLAELDLDVDSTWTQLDPAALAEHIVDVHHRYLHEELPLLDALAAKVHTVHGERHPELADVHRLVAALRADLEPHLMKEERVLFPAIGEAAAGRRDFPFGTIANPIRVMLGEHDTTGELLGELRTVTGSYALPDDACASYRSLYERLEALELDTHQHIHKENHVLFPMTLRMVEAAG